MNASSSQSSPPSCVRLRPRLGEGNTGRRRCGQDHSTQAVETPWSPAPPEPRPHAWPVRGTDPGTGPALPGLDHPRSPARPGRPGPTQAGRQAQRSRADHLAESRPPTPLWQVRLWASASEDASPLQTPVCDLGMPAGGGFSECDSENSRESQNLNLNAFTYDFPTN